MDKGWNSVFWMKPRKQIIMYVLSLKEPFPQGHWILGLSTMWPDRTLPGCLQGLWLGSSKLWKNIGEGGSMWKLAGFSVNYYWAWGPGWFCSALEELLQFSSQNFRELQWNLLEPLCGIHLGSWHWSAHSNGSVIQSHCCTLPLSLLSTVWFLVSCVHFISETVNPYTHPETHCLLFLTQPLSTSGTLHSFQ